MKQPLQEGYGMDVKQPVYIFWDWHGVLGARGFWYKSEKHNSQLRLLISYIFKDKQRIDSWMRGLLSIEELIDLSGAQISRDELAGYFNQDWGNTDVMNVALFSAVKGLYPRAKHVIVTDNMDVFDEYAVQNQYLSENFEHVYSSSVHGVLKGDMPGLFEFVKDNLGLSTFEECLLFDDNLMNCERFRSLGGSAVLVEVNRS